MFRAKDAAHYQPHAKATRVEPYANRDRSCKGWSTYEMLEHLPIRIELELDYSDDCLRRLSG